MLLCSLGVLTLAVLSYSLHSNLFACFDQEVVALADFLGGVTLILFTASEDSYSVEIT